MLTRSIATAFGIALFSAFAFQAQAQDEPRTYQVKFDDLDLNTTSGSRALYHRIDWAAHIVCQDLEGREPERQVQYAHCKANAVSDAIARVGHPHLTAYYSSRNGGKAPVIISQTSASAGRMLVTR